MSGCVRWGLGSADVRKGQAERIQFAVARSKVMPPFAVLGFMGAHIIRGDVGVRVGGRVVLADHPE